MRLENVNSDVLSELSIYDLFKQDLSSRRPRLFEGVGSAGCPSVGLGSAVVAPQRAFPEGAMR